MLATWTLDPDGRWIVAPDGALRWRARVPAGVRARLGDEVLISLLGELSRASA